MPQIVARSLTRTFRIAERSPGLWGALRGLARRRYRTVTALDRVSFSVKKGELVGYIGPNGAGKSTTVKILSGVLVPDAGQVEVLGRVPWKDRVRTVSRIGVVFGQRTQLWWDLPVLDSFQILRDIYRIADRDYSRRLGELSALMGLEDLFHTPVRQLSLGQRMRCEITAALLHDPEILFLDEPTIGLDAASKIAVRDLIRRLNRDRGVTVILTTHDMDDIEALCRRVIVIEGGHVFLDGTLEELCQRVARHRRLIFDLASDSPVICDPDARCVAREGKRVTLQFDPQQVSPATLIGRITARYEVNDLFVVSPPIEEIVASVYERASA